VADNETFGARVRRKRRESGLNQRQLASHVGIDFTYLSKIETDRGLSPGDELVRRLARHLGDDPEELLALAGKVPVDLLRTRAREDPEFARFLRRLADVPGGQISQWTEDVSRLGSRGVGLQSEATSLRPQQVLAPVSDDELGNPPEVATPPTEMSAIRDANINAKLESVPETELQGGRGRKHGHVPGTVVCSYSSDFDTQQDEYLVGLVAKRRDRDRLRDNGAPIHDILVVERDPIRGELSIDELVRRYRISVRYKDGAAAEYTTALLDRLSDTSIFWRPQTAADHFSLVVLRAVFPARRPSQQRRIELSYRFPLPREDSYWFWTASRRMYVSTITVEAKDLTRDNDCVFERFLPNLEGMSAEGGNGTYFLNVSDWVVKGHGVTLRWLPLNRTGTRRSGKLAAAES
jgi:transcriptional regulator with XRE-family HTH domain